MVLYIGYKTCRYSCKFLESYEVEIESSHDCAHEIHVYKLSYYKRFVQII